MKGFPECVALLGDVVRSRDSDRTRVHEALLKAIATCNKAHPGLGGGDVHVIDAKRGIQDGSAWWKAREAIERAEALSRQPGNRTSRTALIDTRAVANPLTDPVLRMVDAALASLNPGARRSWVHLRAGKDNATAAKLEGITPSANSQRINDHGLRPLACLVETLVALP